MMEERLEELESLIDQLEMKLEKALAGGSNHEVSNLKKELKKFRSERDEVEKEVYSCSCKA
ncbi:MAG: hypothetical protein LIO77_07105 [Rikenellaceae bacterium]|nr:hypothetical protein [Rikenellaceae bacterium]